jgi:hypothetical protein
VLFTASIFLFKNNILSQNLIQNGSFEYYNTDPGTSGCVSQFDSLMNWQTINSSDVYASSCTLNNFGVPTNIIGFQYPKNGNTYAGFILFQANYDTKEYIYQHLSAPLTGGKSYYVSFYVSRANRITHAVKSIGAYFSINTPSVSSSTVALIATPQLVNQTGFLTDTIGWSKIEGYFTAQGGEQYLTIGNFNSNANTDTLFVGSTNPVIGADGYAYYYIDSVSLYDSLDYITNIKNNQENIKVNLYPNPNNGNFNIEYHLTKETEFVIIDITGRLVNQYALLPSQNNFSIKEDELKAGIYFYYLKQNNQVLKQDKIVIIK